MSEWIPVSERLPDEETRVLATDGTEVFERVHGAVTGSGVLMSHTGCRCLSRRR
jgi:hypothetical protein